MGNELAMQCTQVESDEPILDTQVDAGAGSSAAAATASNSLDILSQGTLALRYRHVRTLGKSDLFIWGV